MAQQKCFKHEGMTIIGGEIMHYNTIIVGAGAAGLFAAQALAKKQQRVLLIERNSKAGKKLLISGAGQCNFTHAGEIEDFFTCYDDKIKFLKKALLYFDNKQTMTFFQNAGVAYQVLPNAKVFPKTMNSQDILNALLIACQKVNVEMKYNQLVERIDVYDSIFTVEVNSGERYFCNQLIMATGGKSYPQTGSDGKGYQLAQELGHTIIEPRPALTDVRLVERCFKDIAGLSVKQSEVTIWREQKKIRSYCGDLLFTHRGLSGPIILNSSRWMKAKDTLTINFLYPKSYEEIKAYFASEIPKRGKEELITFLKQLLLPKNLYQALCSYMDIDMHQSCAELPKKQREALVNILTRCPLHIEELGDFHIAMVTTGGVHLKEVNPTTLESRIQKGLYFIGEVLDFDGDTGGYNLQAAFSTAALCAKSIIDKK